MKRTIEYIEKMVCQYEGIKPEMLHSRDRCEPYNTVRQMIITLAFEQGHNITLTGAYFDRDHSTAIAARKSIYNRLDTESIFRTKFDSYRELFGTKRQLPIEYFKDELIRLKNGVNELQRQLNKIAI